MTEVQKPSVVYNYNQGAIFLENNMQVGMHTKHINIGRHFLRDVVEEKCVDIMYIRSEEKTVDIMTNIFSQADYAKHAKRIMEGEIWEIVETGR